MNTYKNRSEYYESYVIQSVTIRQTTRRWHIYNDKSIQFFHLFHHTILT